MRPRGVVALDDRDLREVALGVGDDRLVAAHARREHEVLRQDLIPDQPDRPHPLAAREASRNESGGSGAMRTLSRTQSGAGAESKGAATPSRADHAPVLQHERRAERAEVVEQDAVGAVARRDRAHARQAVAERRVQRREQQCVLGRDALRDGDAAHLVDVALAQEEVGLAVVGAEGAALGPVLAHERQQIAQVAGVRGLAQQHPRAAPPLLQRLAQDGRLVIAADAGGQVGVERRADDTRRMAVDPLAGGQRDLRELLGRSGDDGRVVHHLGQPDHAIARQDPRDVLQRERRAGRLERARRHRRRGEDEHLERQALAGVDEPVHALGAERVRELVRIADDGGRAAREQHARQLGRRSACTTRRACAHR